MKNAVIKFIIITSTVFVLSGLFFSTNHSIKSTDKFDKLNSSVQLDLEYFNLFNNSSTIKFDK